MYFVSLSFPGTNTFQRRFEQHLWDRRSSYSEMKVFPAKNWQLNGSKNSSSTRKSWRLVNGGTAPTSQHANLKREFKLYVFLPLAVRCSCNRF